MHKIITLLAIIALPALATEGVSETTISTSDSVVATAHLSIGWKYIRCVGTNFFRLEGTEAAALLEDNSGIKLVVGVLWPVKVTPNTRWIGIRSLDGFSGCYVYPTDNPNPTPLSNITGAAIAPSSITTGAITATSLSTSEDVVVGTNHSSIITLTGGDAGAVTITASGDTSNSILLVPTGAGVVVASGSMTSNATIGNQFACTGAAACNVQSASGRALALDTGGSTATASLGAVNATTTTVGRAGNVATNLNGTLVAGSSTTAGAITLSGGTGTATVRAGARCVCSETTSSVTPGKCALSSTTLTATFGVGTDVINYICL